MDENNKDQNVELTSFVMGAGLIWFFIGAIFQNGMMVQLGVAMFVAAAIVALAKIDSGRGDR